MRIESIYLVNAGEDYDIISPNDGSFPPLGVLSIATTVRKYRPDTEVRVFDGMITEQEYIEQEILRNSPDIVGISVLGTSYQNSLSIAQAAKESGAITIFGNDHAAVMGGNILRKRKEVDYISAADVGEFAFLDFLDFLEGNKRIEEVPKLIYRTGNEIKFNNLPELPERKRHDYFDIIPVPERTILSSDDWETYLNNYLAGYSKFHSGEITGVATMNRARGCSRVKEPCGFCGILDLSLRFSSPEMFWEDVIGAKEQVNANFIYEVFDSMSSAPLWIKKLIQARPKGIEDVKFFAYTQTRETTPKLVELYKQLGVCRVNIGFESGDNIMLKRMKGNRDSVEAHKNAALLLRDAGIKIYGSIVVGAPGENIESLERSVNFAKWLIDEEAAAVVEAQPIWPEFNSRFGKWLLNPELGKKAAEEYGFCIRNSRLYEKMQSKYSGSDSPDVKEISMDWASIFCEIDFEYLEEICKTIHEYAQSKGVLQAKGIFPE
jgi:radical SAM superfamily enzyme YgiQ (UPF0313 family)